MITVNIYQLVSLFLISLYFLGMLTFGLEKVAWQAVPVILATTLSGAVFDYWELKRWSKPITPFITGLIIGLVSSFGEQAPILASLGVAAMLIKSMVKFGGRHIFNPAAGGLLVGLWLFNSQPSWWTGGSHPWIFLIWIPILLLKLKRWAPMVGFLLPLMIINGLSISTSTSLLFFMSVMLIEPKTSPATVKNGLIYGLVVAAFYFLISSFTKFDPFIAPLLIGNLTWRILARYTNN